jgi:chromosome segregation ATPase
VHKIELSKLQSTIDELKQKHANEKQDYENNIKKLSSLHEKELEALKTNTNGEFLNQINGLKNELEKVRKEKLDSEKELNKRYESKLEEIVRKDEEIEILKEKLKNMQKSLESSGTDINLINEELMKAKNDTQKMQKTLNEIEKENSSYRERHDKNVKVLLEKSS